MTYFAVNTQAIKNQTESLSGISRELVNEAREIQQFASNLDFDMSGIRRIKSFLHSLSDAAEKNAASMKNRERNQVLFDLEQGEDRDDKVRIQPGYGRLAALSFLR